MRNKQKIGVSPIIATLLLIVIAVAGAVVTYAFVTGFIGQNTPSGIPHDKVQIDAYNFNGSILTIYVRNIGNNQLTVSSAYIDGALVSNTINTPINTLSVVSIQLSYNATNGSHNLELVLLSGIQYDYNIIK